MKKVIIALIVTSTFVFGAEKKTPQGTLVGPTGIIGSISKNSITVAGMQKGSPADGKLKSGDLILGVGAKKFSNPVRDMAEAIDAAETEEAGGKMTLLLKGNKEVVITLPVLGSYSKTAPFNCKKTDAIITMTADHLMKRKGDHFSIEELALLATGEKKYVDAALERIRNKEWAKSDGKPMKNGIYCTWDWGYRAIVLAEYYLLTKDESVLPALKSLALSIAIGQDARGVYGHSCANPDNFNRIPGYGPMNQPTLSCFTGMLMARKAGIKDPRLDKAIATTYKHVQRHVGKGSFPYGMGGPYSGGFNNNGTSGSATVALELLGDKTGTKFYSMCSATSYDGLEQGHASAFFNPLWTSIGAARSGPKVTHEHFKRTLWFYNMRRSFDGNWSADYGMAGSMDGAALLNYCLGRKALIVTGREMDKTIWAKDNEVMDIIMLSKFDFKSKSSDELIKLAADHPMPQIRRGAGGSLGAHREALTPSFEQWLKSGTTEQKMLAIGQYGWWIKPEEKLPQLPAIGAILTDPKEPEELRKAAASSVAYMGEPAQKYYMDILKLADSTEDVSFGKLLASLCENPFKAGLVTDKELLYRVALRLAGDRDQGPRGQGMHMLIGMPLEDFHRVVDKIVYVLEGTDPDWTSYSAPQSDMAPAIAVLASLNIKEGLDYALQIFELRPKAKHMFRYRATWASLSAYGAAAKVALEKYNKQHNNRTEYGRGNGAYKAMLKAVNEDPNPPKKLISMADALAAGKK